MGKAKGGSSSTTGTSSVHAANKRAAFKHSYKAGVTAGKAHLNKWKDRRPKRSRRTKRSRRKSGSSSARARRQAKRAARRQVRAAKRSAKKSAKKQAKRAAAATPKEE